MITQTIGVALELPEVVAAELEKITAENPEFLNELVVTAVLRRNIYRSIHASQAVRARDRAERLLDGVV